MQHSTYVIVGGGMTADAAVAGIRSHDQSGTISMFSSESDPPYTRPLLSKGLWKGTSFDAVWRGTEHQDITFSAGRTIQSLDPTTKQVADDLGTRYSFDKLLLATGGTPRRLPFGGDQIIYFRTLVSYRRLRAATEQGQRFAVIGGGFIGSEIAAALAMNGKQVTMLFPETGIGAAIYPRDLSDFLNRYYREKGVEVLPGEKVVGLDRRDSQDALLTESRREILVDGVVAGLGITPDTGLAQAAGLAVDNGIVVDEYLRAGRPDIYAAGDVAAFFNPALGKRIRVEHEDNALSMGRLAGENMARAQAGGTEMPYHHLPFFYSDLFDLGYEAVGELDARLETVADWQEPYQQGVVYYLRDGRVRGVLLWNVWGQVDTARALIAEPGPFQAGDLIGRIRAD
jgi:NADPH-dependent 2,4-dienoyl-CoA reductase/sulfur reductase-like enzyme